LLPAAPVVPEKSTLPPALVRNCALPPVPLRVNCVSAPPLVVILALPAVLVSANEIRLPPPLLVVAALPA